MIFPLVGAELFNVDGRTGGWREGEIDITKLTVAFRNFDIPPNTTETNLHT
jgi:hypothetical protein